MCSMAARPRREGPPRRHQGVRALPRPAPPRPPRESRAPAPPSRLRARLRAAPARGAGNGLGEHGMHPERTGCTTTCCPSPRDVPGALGIRLELPTCAQSPREPPHLPLHPAVPLSPRVFSPASTGDREALREHFRRKHLFFPSKHAAISCAVWLSSRLAASSPRERGWRHICHFNTCHASHSSNTCSSCLPCVLNSKHDAVSRGCPAPGTAGIAVHSCNERWCLSPKGSSSPAKP